MEFTHCDGRLYKRMMVAGARWLSLHRGLLNELNVFPVPDGDTGTNLSMTVRGALSPLAACHNDITVSDVANAVARGALMGARGNSGVIMSQILHGLSLGLDGIEVANAKQFAIACKKASECAYKAVQEPREGTILTVIRTIANRAEAIATSEDINLVDLLEQVTTEARQTLLTSYEQLPILREAGVIDAGGLGLVYLFEGMLKVARGEQLTDIHDLYEYTERFNMPDKEALETDIEYGFCVEFLVYGTDLNPEDVQPSLQKLGNSIVLAKTQDILKVHIHTNDLEAVEKLVTAGAINFKRKVENMREQNKRRIEHYQRDISPAQYQASTAEFQGEMQIIDIPSPEQVRLANLPPLVAIVSGDGLCEYAEAWGIVVVPGGQTTNPSTKDILEAIEKAYERTDKQRPVEVFCNNSNCIAAVRQAISLGDIPAKTIETVCPSQMISLLRQPASYSNFGEYVSKLQHGEITQAVRDATVQGKTVNAGDYMAIWNKQLVEVTKSISEASHAFQKDKDIPYGSRLTVIAGEECDPDLAENILLKLLEASPSLKVEFLWGGQPHYPILVTLE